MHIYCPYYIASERYIKILEQNHDQNITNIYELGTKSCYSNNYELTIKANKIVYVHH